MASSFFRVTFQIPTFGNSNCSVTFTIPTFGNSNCSLKNRFTIPLPAFWDGFLTSLHLFICFLASKCNSQYVYLSKIAQKGPKKRAHSNCSVTITIPTLCAYISEAQKWVLTYSSVKISKHFLSSHYYGIGFWASILSSHYQETGFVAAQF